MIIKGLLLLVTGLISIIPFSLPSLPSNVSSMLNTFLGYLNDGIGLLSNFVHIGYLKTLFLIFIGIESALLIYKFAMWVIKKIPMLNVKD